MALEMPLLHDKKELLRSPKSSLHSKGESSCSAVLSLHDAPRCAEYAPSWIPQCVFHVAGACAPELEPLFSLCNNEVLDLASCKICVIDEPSRVAAMSIGSIPLSATWGFALRANRAATTDSWPQSAAL
eukprot:gnl/TRDRNA2_/TRDRNA2_206526_c0_seq1.p1 gnl/TRDRNA2_/TRDRNA2_206526_c0~~gnl/TRDRNA2_/TRDRNA2_206526_c0_seq1.p1  ORF type:complete len:129 (-),score=14.02 gnl/TRDRNA2_/TRDRNA2_206526_c0_seq1:80-466(-)